MANLDKSAFLARFPACGCTESKRSYSAQSVSRGSGGRNLYGGALAGGRSNDPVWSRGAFDDPESLPNLSTLDSAVLQAIYRRSLLLLFALGVPGAFIISMVARPLILWVFGPDFDEAAGVLQILSWAMLLAFLSSLSSGFLAGSNLQDQWLKIAVVATIVNLGSGLVFVPPLQSIGAGIGAVLTYLLLFLLSWWRLAVFFRESRIRAGEE